VLLEDAGRIRQLLVERMRTLQVEANSSPRWESAPHARERRLVHEESEVESRLSLDTPRPGAPPPAGRQELADVLRSLSPDEQLRVVRGFNESRRALLKPREELLAERRPSPASTRGEPLSFSGSRASRSAGLSLEDDAPRPRRSSRLRLD
jgi:hypothetical protein